MKLKDFLVRDTYNLIEEHDFFVGLQVDDDLWVGVGLCWVWLGQGNCVAIGKISMVLHRIKVQSHHMFWFGSRNLTFQVFCSLLQKHYR